jgi:hypothetical protein
MPLDLFAISRGLNSYQDAKKRGQHDVAEQYLSELESGLKLVASAQDLKFAAQEHPLRMAATQAGLRATTQATDFASQEQPLRMENLKQNVEAGQMGIDEAKRKQEEDRRLLTDEEKEMRKPLLPPQFQGLLKGPLRKKDMDAIMDMVKSNLELQGVQAGTEYKQEQVAGQKLENQTVQDKQTAYKNLGTTEGAVVAGTEVAQMEKAEQDVEIAKATVNLRKLQADVAKNNAQRIKEGKSPADMNPYQKLKQFQVDMIDDLIAQGIPENEAYDTVMNQPKQLTYANIVSMLNSLRTQLSTEFDDTKKAELQQKISMYESILQPALDRMAGKKPTAQSAEPTANQIISTSSTDFRSWTPDQRTAWLRQNANMGKRRINLVDDDDKVLNTLNIIKEPNGDYRITDNTGKMVTRISQKPITKKSSVKSTTTPTQTKTQAQPNPKVQAVMQLLKSKRITSISQLEPDIIQTLKAQGIYDQVLKQLGGQ